MKSNILTIGLAAAMLAGVSTQAQVDTNTPLSFTTVNVEAWTGYRYAGDSGTSTAILGANTKLIAFDLGRIGEVYYGAGTEMAIGASGATISDISLRNYIIKDVGLTEFDCYVGTAWLFNEEKAAMDFGVDVKYNLYQSKNWCAYIGSGILFRLRDTDQLEYLPGIQTGIAF